jgi:hypothetical protein
MFVSFLAVYLLALPRYKGHFARLLFLAATVFLLATKVLRGARIAHTFLNFDVIY